MKINPPSLIEKFVATGNDFLIKRYFPMSDHDSAKGAPSQSTIEAFSDQAKALCNRQEGLGADGLIVLEQIMTKPLRLRWHFFNADGSSAEMCGNAARCIGAWAEIHHPKDLFLQEAEDTQPSASQQYYIELETLAGLICLRKSFIRSGQAKSLEPEHWQVQMPAIEQKEIPTGLSTFKEQFRSVHFINSGVPHLVLQVGDKNSIQSFEHLAKKIRADVAFASNGTNVTFFYIEARSFSSDRPDHPCIFVQTFERGVEGFTKACGTGVVAAAVAYKDLVANSPNQSLEKMSPDEDIDVHVNTLGGHLEVLIKHPGCFLSGPAQKVYEIQPEQIKL